MTYTHLGIEPTKSHTQALCSGQSFLNTVLQSRLEKCLGFSTKQHSFSIFSGASGLKKNKIDSTEIITKKIPKKLQYFYRNLKTRKNSTFLATVPNLSILWFDSLSPKTITSVICSKGNWKNISNLKLSPLSSG